MSSSSNNQAQDHSNNENNDDLNSNQNAVNGDNVDVLLQPGENQDEPRSDEGEEIDEEDDADEDEYEDLFEGDIDEEDDEDDGDENDDYDEESNDDNNYDSIQQPRQVTYNEDTPTTHSYLGANFEEVKSSKKPRDHFSDLDEIQLPLIEIPSSHGDQNQAQLLPGQIMPIYLNYPSHINIVKQRIKASEPTIGFACDQKYVTSKLNHQPQSSSSISSNSANTNSNSSNLGILAEILSIRDIDDVALVVRVKGRERFEIVALQTDICGSIIVNVRLLTDISLTHNPLAMHRGKNTQHVFDSYLKKTTACQQSAMGFAKAEYFNMFQAQPAWCYRNVDCAYLTHLIRQDLENILGHISLENQSSISNDPLTFSLWLFNNLPFDNALRNQLMRLNCVNERLLLIYNSLREQTSITCIHCSATLCNKSDVLILSKHGMTAFLNPGGKASFI